MIQLQFLNKLLVEKNPALLTLNNIDESFFSEYSDEYNYIKSHLDLYGRIPDVTTFLNEFPDFDIIKVDESTNFLVDELYRDKNRRFLAKVFNKVRTLLNEGKTDDAMQVYLSAQSEALSAKHLDSIDIFKDTSRYDAYLEKCNDFNKFYIKTGFKELDEIIGGWDRQEELATIAARTNMGKSWILLKCAIAAMEQGLTVGIYSGEMTDKKVGYRIDTLISHISNSAIIRGNREVQNDYKKYIDSLSEKYSGTIKILTPSMLGGPAGVQALQAFIEKDNLDMLCVDQHSLLEDDRHAKNPVEKASNISKDLKNLQVLKKIPIIAVSQQNRASTENGVDTSHIAQSDRIAQDSTIIIFFEQKDGLMTMSLVKSRDSVNMKKLTYAIDLDKGIFNYIPEEGNALNGKGAEELEEEFEFEDNPF